MSEVSTAQLIWHETQKKHYVMFIDVLFEYISSHSQLKANEKLIWFTIFRKSIKETHFWCRLTHLQVGLLVGLKPDTVCRSIRSLKNKGFLKSYCDASKQTCSYSITLPQEGIDLLQSAPNRREKEKKSPIVNDDPDAKLTNDYSVRFSKSAAKSTIIFPKKYPFLLIKNPEPLEANFKMTNKENQGQHSMLLDKFEKLQKINSHLPLIERVKKINGGLSQTERELIHQIIIKNKQIAEQKEKEAHLSFTLNPALPEIQKKVESVVDSISESKMVMLEFDNEKYWIEEKVRDKILFEIPTLFQHKKINGSAAKKSLNMLLREILYYVTKSGSYNKTLINQLKRFHIARNILLMGNWETPRGINTLVAQQYERNWAKQKEREKIDSIKGFQLIRCL
jgi:hypothetical protein